MNYLLNIDCSVDSALVCLSADGLLLKSETCNTQKEHASFIHPAIRKIISEQDIEMQDLKAVAVTIGPGSYTGLRVGLATAKGICYALSKPLITISTLEVLAWDVVMKQMSENALICPMVDARRMEVFTAIYDERLNIVKEAQALILNSNSFTDQLKEKKIIFTGNGSMKFKPICEHENASFIETEDWSESLSFLSNKYYSNSVYSDLALCEPQYIKEYKAF